MISFQDPLAEQKSFLDPLRQHRDWCPWILDGSCSFLDQDPQKMFTLLQNSQNLQKFVPGWQLLLDILLPEAATALEDRMVNINFCSLIIFHTNFPYWRSSDIHENPLSQCLPVTTFNTVVGVHGLH